jgi:hypothetical protein
MSGRILRLPPPTCGFFLQIGLQVIAENQCGMYVKISIEDIVFYPTNAPTCMLICKSFMQLSIFKYHHLLYMLTFFIGMQIFWKSFTSIDLFEYAEFISHSDLRAFTTWLAFIWLPQAPGAKVLYVVQIWVDSHITTSLLTPNLMTSLHLWAILGVNKEHYYLVHVLFDISSQILPSSQIT